ncbi:MAG: hypothetical protein CMJ46_00890 [Planctomyces sp.]|nr:hypothetical protein [Planctomyces sp.]
MVAEHSPEDEARKQFATLVAKQLKELGETDIKYYPRTFSLKHGKDGMLNLHNFYREAEGLGEEELKAFAQKIARQMTGKKEYPAEFEEARSHLLPKVWPFVSLYETKLKTIIKGEEPFHLPTVPLGPHLRLGVVYDLPETMQSVNEDQLEKWGVTFDEALEIAIANLEKVPPIVSKIGDGLCCWMVGDSYDSSRFVSEKLTKYTGLEGRTIAMVPSRGSCFLCDDDDELSQKIMVDLAEQELDGERPLFAIPLIKKGGEWIEWDCPAENENLSDFYYLRVRSMITIYHQMHMVLQAYFKTNFENPVISPMEALSAERNLLCFCLWPDVDSDCVVLPICEKVMFNTPLGVVSADWNIVLEVMRDSIGGAGVYPPHVKVSRYPTQDEFAKIGNDGLLAKYVKF